MSQGMCKVAMAGLGGGGYHAFNELFKERKRVGVAGEDGWSRNGDLEDRGWDGQGQVWVKFSPEALAHPLLLSTQSLGPRNGRSLSRWCGIPPLTLSESRSP